VPSYPTIGASNSLITFSGNYASGGGSLVTGVLTGSALSITPLASGNTTLTITAADVNGNAASSTIGITVVAPPVFVTQPVSQNVTAGGNATLSAVASASTTPTYQWQYNGLNLNGITSNGVGISNVQPTNAGLYTVVATSGVSATSAPAIFGISTTSKVIGTGTELQPANVVHPNGNVYDQVLLTGAAETITADAGQVTRTSYIDDNDDIVQVEFTGAGTLSLVLNNPSGPAAPVNYNQPSVSYMKGHAGIVIAGANETTNVSVFTVGRSTAFDPTGAFNIAQPISTTNNPANNGSPLFQGHGATAYNGIADIAFIAILSTNGNFGGLRTSNAKYSATNGFTGVYAPGVAFTGPVFVGDINASGAAWPVLIVGSTSDARVTGGSLLQTNAQPVKVNGITQLKFTAGGDSQGNTLPAQLNHAVLLQNGTSVASQIVTYP